MKDPIYVSGPMSNYDDFNYPLFTRVTQKLREMGFEVLSPHEAIVEEKTWLNFMRADLAMLLKCNSVVALPGWECSKGAILENNIAHALGLPVLPLSVVLPTL